MCPLQFDPKEKLKVMLLSLRCVSFVDADPNPSLSSRVMSLPSAAAIFSDSAVLKSINACPFNPGGAAATVGGDAAFERAAGGEENGADEAAAGGGGDGDRDGCIIAGGRCDRDGSDEFELAAPRC